MKLKARYLLLTLLAAFLLTQPMQGDDTKIPSCLLSYKFGPEQYILIVEKSSQQLMVYSNYQPKPIQTFKITTGKQNGRKLKEGDLKTPEGLYFFKSILSGDQLPKVDDYGEKAFILNYPNPIDKKEERKGSGIWLHGAFDNKKTSSPNNSRGCVVLQNKDLVGVSKYIFLNQTPICIYEKILFDTADNIAKKRDRLLDYLKQWKDSWEAKNIDGYIKYYADDFSYRGMNRNRFKSYKKNLNNNYTFIKVTLTNINLYTYDGYYVVSFNQLYISDKNHFYSKKIQYWKDFKTIGKISAEQTVDLPPIRKFEFSKGNYMSINEFRKNYLRQLKGETTDIVPNGISISGISIHGKIIKLRIKRSGSAGDLKVIPVIRLQAESNSIFKSVRGFADKEGRPVDYSKGIRLKDRETEVNITRKDKTYKLKSVTLFLTGSKNKPRQILTYYVDETLK
ncbi:MAG: L,D-transpeptidase family protein [bacterium]|nr:L,D-transpeptidase family protein [bacterium]